MTHRRSRKRSQRRSRKRSHRRSHKRSRRLSRRRQSRRHSRYRWSLWPFGKSKVAPATPVAATQHVATAPVKSVVATAPVKPVAAAAFNSRRRKGGRSKHRWEQLRNKQLRKSRRK